MWEALEARTLSERWPDIEHAFEDLYARVSSPSAWASVYDNARFVLTRYAKHTENAAEKAAARAVVRKLQAYAARPAEGAS